MEINSIVDIMTIYKYNNEELLDWLRGKRLVQSNFKCKVKTCRQLCRLHKRLGRPLEHHFYCPKCKKCYSLLTNSFFQRIRIGIRLTLLLMWYWATGNRVGVTVEATAQSKKSVIQLYRFFRDVVSWKLENDENFLLGGPGHVVQVDESVLTERKYCKGQDIAERWIISIYDTNLKKRFVQYVPNRSAETLQNVIVQHVQRGSEVWTDKWIGYSNLSNLGFVQKTVNHSNNFVDPITGVCTNHTEGYQSNLKQYLRRLGVMSSPFLEEYIDQYVWEQYYGNSAKEKMENYCTFLNDTDQIYLRDYCNIENSLLF